MLLSPAHPLLFRAQVGAARPQESHILHYGLHCAVGSFKFTKYSFAGFDANACSGKTFGDPPVSGGKHKTGVGGKVREGSRYTSLVTRR